MSKVPSRSIASMPPPNDYVGSDFGAYLQPRSQLLFDLLKKAEMADSFAPFNVDVGLESESTFDTRQIHAGARQDSATKARAVPFYATASYVFTSSEHARRVCSNEEAGYVYSRTPNPTLEVLKTRIADLEGGTAAVACASGQSAVFQTIKCLARTGAKIVASTALYGGSYSLFKTLLPRMGVPVRWVSTDDAEAYWPLIDDRTKLVCVETVRNPVVSIPDLQGIADIAHGHHVPFVIDSTIGAGGFWCPVASFSADIVVHSATKWLGGHGTTVGGVVVYLGRFD